MVHKLDNETISLLASIGIDVIQEEVISESLSQEEVTASVISSPKITNSRYFISCLCVFCALLALVFTTVFSCSHKKKRYQSVAFSDSYLNDNKCQEKRIIAWSDTYGEPAFFYNMPKEKEEYAAVIEEKKQRNLVLQTKKKSIQKSLERLEGGFYPTELFTLDFLNRQLIQSDLISGASLAKTALTIYNVGTLPLQNSAFECIGGMSQETAKEYLSIMKEAEKISSQINEALIEIRNEKESLIFCSKTLKSALLILDLPHEVELGRNTLLTRMLINISEMKEKLYNTTTEALKPILAQKLQQIQNIRLNDTQYEQLFSDLEALVLLSYLLPSQNSIQFQLQELKSAYRINVAPSNMKKPSSLKLNLCNLLVEEDGKSSMIESILYPPESIIN